MTMLILFLFQNLSGQDIINSPSSDLTAKYINRVSNQAGEMNEKIDQKSSQALAQFEKTRNKIISKLEKIDSNAAKSILQQSQTMYTTLLNSLNSPQKRITQYVPFLDSVGTSLKFLDKNKDLLAKTGAIQGQLEGAMSKVGSLQDQFQKADQIKQFLDEQKKYLTDKLENNGLTRQLNRLSKNAYYYGQQIREYKEILNNPDKIEQKTIELLSHTKPFQDFMKKNSLLASLFKMPTEDDNNPEFQASLAGLQTKAQVNKVMQDQIGSGGAAALKEAQGNVQDAQGLLQKLKDKMNSYGNSSSDQDMPDFKPNNEKVKTFLNRLDYGFNFQTNRSTSFLPVTSELGLSLGYKLNDRSIVGIGVAYDFGWGYNFQHIKISQEGVGIRSFIDYKLKNIIWLTGGFEMNYKSTFSSINELKVLNAWQKSGLIGISKKLPVNSKMLKVSNIQLLWDFLSYYQIPQTQPIVFRVGFSIK